MIDYYCYRINKIFKRLNDDNNWKMREGKNTLIEQLSPYSFFPLFLFSTFSYITWKNANHSKHEIVWLLNMIARYSIQLCLININVNILSFYNEYFFSFFHSFMSHEIINYDLPLLQFFSTLSDMHIFCCCYISCILRGWGKCRTNQLKIRQ